MTEKELEKLFKSKLGDREVPFNPENWERMEAILDEKAAVRRGYYWKNAAAILIFGAVVASLIFINPGMDSPSERKNIAAPSAKEEVQETGTGNTVADEPGQKSNQEYLSAPAEDASTEENPGSPMAEQSNKEISETPEKLAEEKIVAANESTTEAGESENTRAMSKQDAPPVSTNAEEATAGYFEAIDLLDLNDKGYRMPEAELPGLTTMALDLSITENQPPHNQLNLSDFFVNAGPVFSNSHTGSGTGTGLQAGLGYRFRMRHGFSLETGISYVVQNDLNITNKSDSTFFNFGRERVETEEVNHRLDYIEIPLNVSYRFAPKHELGLGTYFSLLVNVERETQRTRYTIKGGMNVENEQSSGYLSEFSRIDYGLGVFYRYSVSSRFKVGLHLKQGLNDITMDISEGYAEDHSNFNSRIVLEYSLF